MQNSKVALVAGINKKDNALYGGKNKDNQLKAFVSTLFGLKKFWRNDGYVIRGSMRGRYAVGITNKVPTEWAMGYFFSVKKSLCDKCTIQFDENLKRYAYAEDLDFSIRYCEKAKIGGRACILNPEIYVDHLASKEWRTPSKEATLYAIANRRYLSYKLYPKKFWNRWLLLWNDWCCEKFVCKNVDERKNWHEARMLCKSMKIDELKELILNASKR